MYLKLHQLFLLLPSIIAYSDILIENTSKYSDAFVAPIFQILDIIKSFNIILIGATDSFSQSLFFKDKFLKQLNEERQLILNNFEM